MRIFRDVFERPVANAAPTGAASILLPPPTSTIHSLVHPPHIKAEHKATAQLDDYPLGNTSPSFYLGQLQRSVGSCGLVNFDERSMWSHELLAGVSFRFGEATGKQDADGAFGGVPTVNFFGDLGQLPAGGSAGLHVAPKDDAGPIERGGYTLYRSFSHAVVLSETKRQGPEEAPFLARLLRLRRGLATQEDWLAMLARLESRLTPAQRTAFETVRLPDGSTRAPRVLTLFETWKGANRHNRQALRELGMPVACIPAVMVAGRPPKGEEKEVGQLPEVATMAAGMRVILTRNQGGGKLVRYGLNNGAMGRVVATLFARGAAPPAFPEAVVVDFPSYTGPAWIAAHPTWVPVPVQTSKDMESGAIRTGIPLKPGYAVVIHKSQGISIGDFKPAERMRLELGVGRAHSNSWRRSLALAAVPARP